MKAIGLLGIAGLPVTQTIGLMRCPQASPRGSTAQCQVPVAP